MKLTAKDIAHLQCYERLGFESNARFCATGVSCDSRTLQRGDIFVALRGERFDGHDFVSAARQNGMVAVIVEKHWADYNRPMLMSLNTPALIVENSTKALGELARIYRRKFSIPIILLAGSNGKTTTKELTAAVLKTRYRVLATEQNFNNHIGVPKTLFQLNAKHEVAVLEAGTNHHGELAYLCEIAEPTHGLLTNIGNEHLEFFGSLEGVATAEGELFEYLRFHSGVAFVNVDDPRLRNLAKGIRKNVRYGFTVRGVPIRGKKLRVHADGSTEFFVVPKTKKEFAVRVPLPGIHNAGNALAAIAVGLTFQVPTSHIQQAIATTPPPSKRMEVHRLGNLIIVNDTYNANPDSMIAALKTLSSIDIRGKRIVVLGDMLELGQTAEVQHRNIGKALAHYRVDVAVTYGHLAQFISAAAVVPEKHHYEKKEDVYDALRKIVKPGDGVLVKGSRAMKMEEAVAFLIEQFSHSMDA